MEVASREGFPATFVPIPFRPLDPVSVNSAYPHNRAGHMIVPAHAGFISAFKKTKSLCEHFGFTFRAKAETDLTVALHQLACLLSRDTCSAF